MTADGMPLIVAGKRVNSSVFFQGNAYFSSGSAFVIKWENMTYDSLDAWRAATRQETDGDGGPLGVQVGGPRSLQP